MHIALKIGVATVIAALVAAGGAGAWFIHTKQPVRSGSVALKQL